MNYRGWLFKVSTIGLLAWANNSFVDSDFVPNQPSGKFESVKESIRSRAENSDSLLFILSLSGGGTRSAALSYGALKALRDTTIETSAGPQPALKQIDTIYAVSGGAFTAAYYGLYGDKIFSGYEDTFLRRNLNIDFPPAFAKISVIKKLMRKDVGRSEAMVSYLDDLLFSGHTIDELLDSSGPKIEISASDLASGHQFTFSTEGLSSICSDARSIPVARAITASSAVPVLYSPVRLNNYSTHCTAAAGSHLLTSNTIEFPKQQKFIHLADGGLTDNTGLGAFLHKVKRYGSVRKMLAHEGSASTKRIMLMYVDASVTPNPASGTSSDPMSTEEVVSAATATMIKRYSQVTLSRVRQVLSEWKAEMTSLGKPVDYDLIHLSFDDLGSKQSAYFNSVPTSFALSKENVDHLIASGSKLVYENASFRDRSTRNASLVAEND